VAARREALREAAPEGDTEVRRHITGTGHERLEFIGTRSFVKDLGSENRLARINDPTAMAMVARGLIKL
jgi:hypothetical protein